MLYITRTVGYQSAVYDTDDGTLEWISNKDIESCIKGGMALKKGQPLIHAYMCNINKDHSNLFERCSITKDTIINKFGKKFKFKLDKDYLYLSVGLKIAKDEVFH